MKILSTEQVVKLLNECPFDCKAVAKFINEKLKIKISYQSIVKTKRGHVVKNRDFFLYAMSMFFHTMNFSLYNQLKD